MSTFYSRQLQKAKQQGYIFALPISWTPKTSAKAKSFEVEINHESLGNFILGKKLVSDLLSLFS